MPTDAILATTWNAESSARVGDRWRWLPDTDVVWIVREVYPCGRFKLTRKDHPQERGGDDS